MEGSNITLRLTGTFIQHAGEPFPPAQAEAGCDLHLVGELGPVVRSQPSRQGPERGRSLGDLLGERDGELPRDGACSRRFLE